MLRRDENEPEILKDKIFQKLREEVTNLMLKMRKISKITIGQKLKQFYNRASVGSNWGQRQTRMKLKSRIIRIVLYP